jgi:hypothetical protein
MSALEQFLLSDQPLSATTSSAAAAQAQPMPSLEDELFDENVDEYLNELGELDEDFDDAMLSSIATELPAAARQALRQVVKNAEAESIPELTDEARQQLAQNVVVEIEPADSYGKCQRLLLRLLPQASIHPMCSASSDRGGPVRGRQRNYRRSDRRLRHWTVAAGETFVRWMTRVARALTVLSRRGVLL